MRLPTDQPTFLNQTVPHARGPFGGGRAQQHDPCREDGEPRFVCLGGFGLIAWACWLGLWLVRFGGW